MKEFFTRLTFFFRRRAIGELDDELRFHIEQLVESYMAAGMDPDQARRQALLEFGGVERAREQTYEQRPGWWIGTVRQDVRYALRGFRRNWVFTVAVIATLAVGIGATTAVFSVVDRISFARCRMRTMTGSFLWAWWRRLFRRSSCWAVRTTNGATIRRLSTHSLRRRARTIAI